MPQTLFLIENTKADLIAQLQQNDFLQRCSTGQITLDELKFFLVQQGIYSNYFTRYLCALMSNLPDNKAVFELAENLFEELGFAPDSPTPHYIIYREMLEFFGLNINSYEPTQETKNLINTMFSYCRNHEPIYGLSALCLGAEALVPTFYSDIIKGFKSCGIDDENIEFFHLHVHCDDGHAETLLKLLSDYINEDADKLDAVVETGKALVNARCDFLSSISKNYSK